MKASSESGNRAQSRRRLGLALAVLAACGWGSAGAQTTPHNPSPTTITIVPATTTPKPPGICQTFSANVICLSEDPIDLSNDVNRPVSITWKIVSPAWTFEKNKGIAIKGGQWSWGTRSDTEYVAEQKAKKDGTIYKYTINVTDAKSGATISWDPTIKN